MNWYTAQLKYKQGNTCEDETHNHDIEEIEYFQHSGSGYSIPLCTTNNYPKPVDMVETKEIASTILERVEQLFVEYFKIIYNKAFTEYVSNGIIQSKEKERREIHFKIKKLFGSSLNSVNIAVNQVKQKRGEFVNDENRQLYRKDKSKVKSQIWDYAYDCAKYMFDNQLSLKVKEIQN